MLIGAFFLFFCCMHWCCMRSDVQPFFFGIQVPAADHLHEPRVRRLQKSILVHFSRGYRPCYTVVDSLLCAPPPIAPHACMSSPPHPRRVTRRIWRQCVSPTKASKFTSIFFWGIPVLILFWLGPKLFNNYPVNAYRMLIGACNPILCTIHVS